MCAVRVQDTGQSLKPPVGKVLGIVDTREQFDRLEQALKSAGFSRIEYLIGEDGVQLLERLDGFFFSDLEERILKRHIEELQAGHAVVAIQTPSEQIDQAVQVASQNGARRLVHIGALTVTWHTK